VPAKKALGRVIKKTQALLTNWAVSAGFSRHVIVGQLQAMSLRNMVDLQALESLDQRCKALFRALKARNQPLSIKQAQNAGTFGLSPVWTSADGRTFELNPEGTMRFNAIQSLTKDEKQQRMASLPGSHNYDARFAHGNILASLQRFEPGSGWRSVFASAEPLVRAIALSGEGLLKKAFIYTVNGGSWTYGGSVWALFLDFTEGDWDLAVELREQLLADDLWSAFIDEVERYESANGDGSVGRLCRSTMTAYIDHVIEQATRLGFNVWSHEHDGVFCDVPPDIMASLQASANSAFHVSLELREKPFAA
jgi:hypothetical protein